MPKVKRGYRSCPQNERLISAINRHYRVKLVAPYVLKVVVVLVAIPIARWVIAALVAMCGY